MKLLESLPDRRIVGAGFLAVVLMAMIPGRGTAQYDRGPVFRLQPGLLSADFLSAPRGVSSATGFNIRFETRFPTGGRWIVPVIGASVTPYGTSGYGAHDVNTPALFAGNIFPAVRAARTRGWATIEVPVLFYYTYGGGGEHNRHPYGRDLYAQLALHVHVGAKTLRDLGPTWSRLDAYGFLEQNLTPNKSASSGRTDRFDPVALFGISLPFGQERPTP